MVRPLIMNAIPKFGFNINNYELNSKQYSIKPRAFPTQNLRKIQGRFIYDNIGIATEENSKLLGTIIPVTFGYNSCSFCHGIGCPTLVQHLIFITNFRRRKPDWFQIWKYKLYTKKYLNSLDFLIQTKIRKT